MTDKHSITPTPELVHQWHREACRDPYHGGAFIESKVLKYIAASAARWGADQANHDIERKLQEARDEELGACVQTLKDQGRHNVAADLRAVRRPKSPSLKGQALTQLDEALLNPQSPLFNTLDNHNSVSPAAVLTILFSLLLTVALPIALLVESNSDFGAAKKECPTCRGRDYLHLPD